jgi:hypothetical protein
MQKIITIIIAISITAMLIVPDSWIGDYQGVHRAKYFLREQIIRAKDILISLAKGEKPKEFNNLDNIKENAEQDIKDTLKDTLKETAKEAIDEL